MWFVQILIIQLMMTLTFSQSNFQQLTTLNQFQKFLESQIVQLAGTITNAYNLRCSNPAIQQCQNKIVDTCLGTGQQSCLQWFPKFPNCTQPGSRLSLFSGIRQISGAIRQSQLNQQDKIFICATSQEQLNWRRIYQRTKYLITNFYFGSYQGFMKIYPSFHQIDQNGECPKYDPRLRPWYATAISSSKNIVIALPFSGLVKAQNNLQRIKSATKIILNTLSRGDFVNIVLYNQRAFTIDPRISSLIRATESNLQHFKQLVEKLDSPGGSVNYKILFSKIFQILKQVEKDTLGAPCPTAQNIVLLFADGNAENQTFFSINNHIQSIKAEQILTIFTYQLPQIQLIDTSLSQLLLNIACSNGGIYFKLQKDPQLFKSKISSYFTFISEGLNKKDVKPAWSSPYTDTMGLGRIITVVYPAYYQEVSNGVLIRKLLGVAGMDVRIDEFEKKFPLLSQSQIEQTLLTTTCANASEFRVRPCKLENLRPQNAKCGNIQSPQYLQYKNCPKELQIRNCSINSGVKILSQFTDNNSGVCCHRSNIGVIIGVVVGVIVALIIILLATVLVFKKCRKNVQQSNQQIEQQPYWKNSDPPMSSQRFSFPRDGDILTEQQRQQIINLKFGVNDN